jgi:hypothetical protein
MQIINKYTLSARILISICMIIGLILLITCIPLFIIGNLNNGCSTGCYYVNSDVCGSYTCFCPNDDICQNTSSTELDVAIVCLTFGIIFLMLIACAHCCCQTCIFKQLVQQPIMTPYPIQNGLSYTNIIAN